MITIKKRTTSNVGTYNNHSKNNKKTIINQNSKTMINKRRTRRQTKEEREGGLEPNGLSSPNTGEPRPERWSIFGGRGKHPCRLGVGARRPDSESERHIGGSVCVL